MANVITEDRASGAQVIDGSLKFDRLTSDHFSRTPGSASNRKTWTWSSWIKNSVKTAATTNPRIFTAGSGGTNTLEITILAAAEDNELRVLGDVGGSRKLNWTTDREVRDTGWFHITVALDTTQVTSSDRLKLYYNGVLQGSGAASTYPSLNDDFEVNNNSVHYIGKSGPYTEHFDGSMSQCYFIDGRALDASYFGFTDPLTNTWRPKKFDIGAENNSNNGTTWDSTNTTAYDGGSQTDTVSGTSKLTGVNGNFTSTLSSSVIVRKSLRLQMYASIASFDTYCDIQVNGSGEQTVTVHESQGNQAGIYDLNFTGTLSSIKVTAKGGANIGLAQVIVDDYVLINGAGDNTFYLPMDGNSVISQDQSGKENDWTPVNFGGSAALDKATGALPILNTDGGGNVARIGTRTDPYASSIVMAIPFLSNVNDISADIKGSGSNLTVTPSGSPAADSYPYQWYGSSFNVSTNNYIDEIGTNNTFAFLHQPEAAGTIEGWINTNAINNQGPWFQTSNGTDEIGLMIRQNSSTNVFAQINRGVSGQAINISGDVTVAHGRWYHWAFVKSANGYAQFFLNGHPVSDKVAISSGAGASNAASTSSSSAYPGRIARNHGETRGVGANICDYRAYTVQKYAFDTSFIPASTNPDILPDTPSGVSSKSKLAKVTDGSVYFDGTDFLSLASSTDFGLVTQDWTVECYAYIEQMVGSYGRLWYLEGSSAADIDGVYFSNTHMSMGSTNVWSIGDGTGGEYRRNKWMHVAVCHDSTNMRMYIDGVQALTSTNNFYNSASKKLTLMSTNNGLYAGTGQGYISNFRIVNGTALYTSNFTPPTSPLTNVTNTKLLCCQGTTPFKSGACPILNTTRDGSAITSGLRSDPYNSYLVFSLPMNGSNGGTTFTDQSDSSQSISVNGNTQTSTANSKYYGSSALFDGSGDSLTIGSTSDFAFGTGDYTIEMWVYHTDLTGQQTYFGDTYGGTSGIYTYKTSTNQVSLYDNNQRSASATNIIHLNTWHHLAWTRTSGVIREFVDGSCVSRDTPSTANYTVTQYYLGDTADQTSGEFFGYMQDVRVYKGVSKYTDNFIVTPLDVQPQADKIITPAGSVQTTTLSPFNTNINMERGDKSLFATWSPLESNTHVLSNGNLTAADDDNAWDSVVSTIGASTGKYYAEYTVDIKGWNVWGVDQLDPSKNGLIPASEHPGSGSGGFGWVFDPSDTRGDLSYNQFDGTGQNHYYNSGNALSSAVGDIISVAMDLDNNNVKFMKNGKIIFDIDNHLLSGYTYFFSYGSYQTAGTTANFGQKPFRYTPPEGFGPITGASVRPETVISRPDQYVAASIWTGDGTENRLIPLNMKPDLIWIKQRNDTRVHILQDSVRGFTKGLYSDDTDAESTRDPGYGEAVFGGFEVSNGAGSNVSGRTMVAWNWKAGGNKNTFNVDDVGYASAAAAGLNGGTITPTGASVGTKQGFSILKYQGNGSAGANISHGLLKAPKLMIHKSLDASRNWYTITTAIDGSADYLYLNSTAVANNSAVTAPTSNLMYFTSSAESNNNTENYIVYMWHDVPGLQKFGSYVGNNDANGTYVELGFRPAVVIIKTTSGGSWVIKDSARKPVNPNDSQLYANTTADEDDPQGAMDFLSNGFKSRVASQSVNASETYIYAAWAEAPSFNLYGGQSNAR